MKKLILTLLLLLITPYVYAAPAITGVTGNLVASQNLTISGTGFGTKSTAAPLLWDTFEAGTVGNEISEVSATIGSWDAAWYYSPTYSTTTAHSGSKSSFHLFRPGTSYTVSLKKELAFTKFYLDYWCKIQSLVDVAGRGWKQWRAYGNSYQFGHNPGCARLGAYDSSYVIHDGTTGLNNVNWDSFTYTTGQWYHFQCWVELGGNNTADGKVHWYVNNSPGLNSDAKITRTNSTAFSEMNIGHYWAFDGVAGIAPANGGADIYIDNVYFDTGASSWARVMLGNNSVFTSCTKTEPQIPNKWKSDGTAIGITVNQGSFALTDSVWLFVIDSDGSVSSGYPVTFTDYPIISDDTGTYSDGESVSVVGANFGTKSTAAPTYWDNFEANVDTTGVVGTCADIFNLTQFNETRGVSTKSAGVNMVSGSTDNGKIKMNNTPLSAKWFIQYWFKLNSNWDWGTTTYDGVNKWLSNIKTFRLWNPGSYQENLYTGYSGWGNECGFVKENLGSQSVTYFLNNARTTISKDVWHLFQFQYSENSGLNQSDGTMRIWFDGAQVVTATNVITRVSENVLKRPFLIGFENEWSASEGTPDTAGFDGDNNFYIDDIYVDTTWARVELGNQPLWADCTHREIQIPTAWTDTGVTFTVNQGSFEADDQVYLYIIDEDGNPSDQSPGEDGARGFPVTIGGTATDTTPPSISGRNPAPSTTGVSLSADIVFTLSDAGSGVDTSTITCTVEGTNETADLDKTGGAAAITCTLPSADHDAWTNSQVINVVINADDLDGNSMTQVEYSFTTLAADEPESASAPPSINFGTGRINSMGSASINT